VTRRLGYWLAGLCALALAGDAAAAQLADNLQYVPLNNSPFPYAGKIPASGEAFLDVNENRRRGHTAPRGGVRWEDQTYSDRHVLLYLPKGFDIERPAVMVVYLHGNLAILRRDVAGRQQVPRQVAQSGLNAVLVAPQFAVDANDSSAGKFWEPGVFARFLAEAGEHLARLYGGERSRGVFAAMPVVLVAYSGGYNPAAYVLATGGAESRLRGVILLDALYGETDKFAEWIVRRRGAFFFSAYSRSSRAENLVLQRMLGERQIKLGRRLGPPLVSGSVTFLATDPDIEHKDFVNRAWVADPLRAVLARIPGYPRGPSARPARPGKR